MPVASHRATIPSSRRCARWLPILGGTADVPDRTFQVVLSGPTDATLLDEQRTNFHLNLLPDAENSAATVVLTAAHFNAGPDGRWWRAARVHCLRTKLRRRKLVCLAHLTNSIDLGPGLTFSLVRRRAIQDAGACGCSDECPSNCHGGTVSMTSV